MSRRRPAAAAVPRRRPASSVEDPPGRGRRREDIAELYTKGEPIDSHLAPLTLLERGHWLVSEKSTYFEEECKWAGKVVRVTLEGGEAEVQVQLTGTQCESLLKYASGQNPAVIRAHLCKPGCDQKRVNPDLVHLRSFRRLEDAAEKSWEVNLVSVDENEPLRRAEEAWSRRQNEGDARKEASSVSSSSRKKKKKKKKEKKKAGEKKPKKELKVGGKALAKKELKALYQGTGLDPDVATRRKVVKKVKRRLKKGRPSSSSSSSGSSTSSAQGLEDEILEDRSKIQRIAVAGPGILAAAAVQNMKQFVMQSGGSTWAMDEDSLPPVMGQYARQHLAHRTSGGILREVMSLSFVGDLLLQGRAAEALDGVAQRLKGLELLISGQPWATAQRVEITPPLEAAISSRAEIQVAMRESKLDSQARGGQSSWEKGRGKSKSKDKDKGKGEKGKSKGREDAKKSS